MTVWLFFLLHTVYVTVLLVISYWDIREKRIPDRMILPAILLAAVAMFFTPGWKTALIGAAVGGAIMLVPMFVMGSHGGMGDVKLAVFIGLILGFPGILPALVVAYLTASLLWIGVLLKKWNRKTRVPFGPFLALGALVSLAVLYWM